MSANQFGKLDNDALLTKVAQANDAIAAAEAARTASKAATQQQDEGRCTPPRP